MNVDYASETWAAVLAWVEKEKLMALEVLTDRRTSHDETQFQRGILEAIRRLESVDSPAVPIVPMKSVDY